jgi:hypothetical protein
MTRQLKVLEVARSPRGVKERIEVRRQYEHHL